MSFLSVGNEDAGLDSDGPDQPEHPAAATRAMRPTHTQQVRHASDKHVQFVV